MSAQESEIKSLIETLDQSVTKPAPSPSIYSDPAIEILGIGDPHRSGLYKIFRSDQRLTQEEISSLLGIQDTRHSLRIEAEFVSPRQHLSVQQFIVFGILSLLSASALFFALIYFDKPQNLQANLDIKQSQ